MKDNELIITDVSKNREVLLVERIELTDAQRKGLTTNLKRIPSLRHPDSLTNPHSPDLKNLYSLLRNYIQNHLR